MLDYLGVVCLRVMLLGVVGDVRHEVIGDGAGDAGGDAGCIGR